MKIAGVFKNRCPNCQRGKVYVRNNLASFGNIEMNDRCKVCNMDFQKDPGFYWGSMYVSYALSIIEALIAYAICRISGSEAYDWLNLIVVISAILICSALNYRLARLIWLYLFPS